MDIYVALEVMAQDAGLTLQGLSKKSGRTRNYLHVIKGQHNSPTLRTLSELAELCDYEIHLVGHGRDITLNPDGSDGDEL